MHGVIQYLLYEGHSVTEIHCQLVFAYVIDVMNRQNVAKWVLKFKDGKTNVHVEDRSERPTVFTNEFIVKVKKRICADRVLATQFVP